MRLAHIGVVTLVNQVFFGGDIVVKAGLGKTQTACHIRQRGRSRSLGIKQLDSDPFQDYLNNNPKYTTVKGVIAEVDERNALVNLADKVNGLLNVSEVSRDKVEDMRSSFRPNDEVEAKIIGFDRKNRTIKLSIKAKEETEEKEALETYQKDEKENISKTSLGDLLKSKFTKGKD